MASNTRNTQKITEEDSRGRRSSPRLASAVGSAGGDPAGLRRSTRETSSKKTVTPERPTTRMSGRLEKQTPPAPSVAKKSVTKRLVESPLRRSERCKQQCLSMSPSGSKNSGKNLEISASRTENIEKMEEGEKENATKKSAQRDKEATTVESEHTRKEWMDSHAYKALFRKQEKKVKLSGDANRSSSKIDVDGSSRTIVLAIGNAKEFPIHFEEISRPRKSPAQECTNSQISEKLSSAGQHDNPEIASNLDSFVNNNVQSLPSPSQRVDTSNGVRSLEERSLVEVQVLPGTYDSIPNRSPSEGNGCMDMGPEVVIDASAVVNCKDDPSAPSPSSSTKNLGVEKGALDLQRKSGEIEAGLNSRVGEDFTNNAQQLDQAVEHQANGQNNCHICKLGGLLLCCDGKDCERSFHLSCLNPPLEVVPLGIWYCLACVKKRMEFGAHSISKGVEAIFGVREVEASDANGLHPQKQFFVKYKGLAHIHNRWVPEAELLIESPSAVARFNKRKTVKWKPEWAMPQRLLEKRLEIVKQQDEMGTADRANCCYQWLVKWCGLGYELATWELENEPFFKCSEVKNLINKYETRHDRTRRPLMEMDKLRERKKALRSELSNLPDGISVGSDSNSLDVVNSLREFWRKSRNAIIIDDQEYMLKVISFITSLQSDVCRPFLIIASSSSLNSWDEEFLHLGRYTDVVVYDGDKEFRKSIKNVEFFDNGGATMLEVLLAAPRTVAEDMDVLMHIEWEAIIVDECQRPGITRHFEEFKMLNTEMRLLLYRGPLKESLPEYSDLLSLLDHQSGWKNGNGFGTSSNDSILKMKERLSSFIVSGCKVESSRFLEYWVPVQLSNVQLEQYCATLLSNSFSLRSPLKSDPVGALRDTVYASRKCCDHPYLVEPLLQNLLIKDLPVVQYLDVGIKASGKLQLLDKLLLEVQKRDLRALIMFQSPGGSGRDSLYIGDILDDLLGQRFGAESYERIDGDVARHKKVGAMNRYNNKDLGRFVFLLESRACHPSIKLVSVDVVIIYGSDWNPLNDMRNLQKVQLESRFEPIKLFRLYTSGTVEEKVLINAKNGDSGTMQYMSPASSHSLLMWGAKHLFDNLKEFHHKNRPSSCTVASDQSHTEDVLRELLTVLPKNDKRRIKTGTFLISRAWHSAQTYYSKEISLPGESKIQSPEELPHLFWTKLLEGKAPDWKYSSVSQQRNRKRVQMNDSDEAGNKRRKVAEINADFSSKRKGKDELNLAASKQASGHVQAVSQGTGAAVASEVKTDGSDERRTLRDAQSRLHLILKPQISRLCEALSLEVEVKNVVYTFLDYVINNRVVNQEPATILQAFLLALCWTAASLVKLKIDHKESLALAKERLNYGCSKDEAEGVYTILRGLKKPFLREIENSEAVHLPKASEAVHPSKAPEIHPPKAPEKVHEIPKDSLHSNLSRPPVILPNIVKIEIQDSPLNQESSDKDVLSSPALAETEIIRSQEIPEECSEQMVELLREQGEERSRIYMDFEVEKGALEDELRLEMFFMTQLHRDGPVRAEKLKALESQYARKIKERKNRMNIRLKELEEAQLAARIKFQQKEASSVDGVRQDQTVSVDPVSKAGNQVENLQTNDGGEAQQALQNEAAPVSEGARAPIPSFETGECLGTQTVLEHSAGPESLDQDAGDAVSLHPLPEDNIPDGATPAVPGSVSSQGQIAEGTATVQTAEVPLGISENINDVPARAISLIPQSKDVVPVIPLSEVVLPREETSTVPNRDITSDVPADVSSSRVQAPENVGHDDIRSSEARTQIDGEAMGTTPDEEPALCPPGNVNIQESREVQLSSSGEQTHVEPTLEAPGVVPDEVNTAPENDLNEAERASEHREDGISPMEVDNVIDIGNQDIPRQLVATPSPGAAMPLNQSSTHQRETSSMPHTLQEADASERTNDIPPDTGTAQLFDRPDHGAAGTEVALQVRSPLLNLPTVDGPAAQTLHEEDASQRTSDMSPDAGTAEPGGSGTEAALQVPSPPPNLPTVDGLGGPTLHEEDASQQTNFTPPDDETAQQSDRPDPGASGMEAALQVSSPPPNLQTVDALAAQTLHEEDASQQTDDMPLHSGTAQESDLPEPSASGREAALQFRSPPPNLQTVDVLLHQRSMEEALNALNQCGLQPSMPSGLQMAIPPLSHLDTSSLSTQPSLSRVAQMALPKCSDPLQNELDRLKLESDLTAKIYEDTRTKLKTDCEKEIEVVVAEIRRKYAMKFQDAEAEYLSKRNELQSIQTKVHMHRILAEAFRSKCMDLRASTALAVQQDAIAAHAQQLLSSPSQLNPQASPSHVPRTSASVILQNNIRTPTPHPINPRGLQPMDPSSSVRAPRPPVIGQFPAPGNVQVQRAPHLSSFRPIVPPLTRRASPPPPPGYSPTPTTNLPPHRPARYSREQRSVMATPNSRESAMELLLQMAGRPVANQQLNGLQGPSMNLTAPGSSPAIQGPSTGNNSSAQPICLSDDD